MLMTRDEEARDHSLIHAVHAAAFPTDAEARLVAALRAAGRLTVSLVAEFDGRVAGHVALSPVTLDGAADGLGLGPVAVLPELQRRGIGRRLVHDGLRAAAQKGAGFVVVLGDPAYYGQLGFRPASHWSLRDEYGGGEAFQAIELRPGSMPPKGGLVQYAPEFGMVSD